MTRRPPRFAGLVRLAVVSVTAAGTLLGAGTAAATPGAASLGPLKHASCATAVVGGVRCFTEYRAQTRAGEHPAASTPPVGGLGPADIASAYKLTGGSSATIGIVDAYDDPHAEADLAVYRRHYGLPACTTANGCFRKVNQAGKSAPLPDTDSGWALEISLDVDAASAACPSCKILLVEGDDPSFASLGTAVDTAVAKGAAAVSNSYGTDEFNGMNAYAAYYKHPGVPIVVSSGDFGFTTAQFPAVYPFVVAVGGTTLTKAAGTSRGWREQAWDGAGSGCSAYIAKSSWQHDTHCTMRTVSDVSAVADPDSGFVVYDTYGLGSDNGYLEVGGTSLSSPLITAMIVRAGRHFTGAQRIYSHRSSLFDPTGGSNGYCGGDYLCTGKTGYDAPTGIGSPNGLNAL
jgi:subtilase family serine protease